MIKSGISSVGVTIVTSINEYSFGRSFIPGDRSIVSVIHITYCVRRVPTTLRVVRCFRGLNCRAAYGVVTVDRTSDRRVRRTLTVVNRSDISIVCLISSCNSLCPRATNTLTGGCLRVNRGCNGTVNFRTRGGRGLTFTGAVRALSCNISCLSTATTNVKEKTNGYTVRLLLKFLGGPGCGLCDLLAFLRGCVVPLGRDNMG